METLSDAPPSITGAAPLYKNPQPLNAKDHGKLGLLNYDTPYFFAAKQHFVPLVASEFGNAACTYPIVFAGKDMSPIAIMGLKPDENLFLPEAANIGMAYVPAYVRRYPFIAAAAEQEGQGASIVCIDAESEVIGENPARPLFDNGQFTEYANHCIRFCQNYENDRMTTKAMTQRLQELDLFEFRSVKYRPHLDPEAPAVEVAGFNGISEEKLNALPIETYLQLRDSGILTCIFAHWVSQSHWDRMIAMASNKLNVPINDPVIFGR